MVTKGRPLFESNADRKSRERREHEAQRAEERAAERLRRQEEPTELEQLQDRVEKLEAVFTAIMNSPWTDSALESVIREAMQCAS